MEGTAGRSRRILVIFNPTAGWFNLRKIDRLVERVRDFGCEVVLHRTTARGDAEAVAGSGEARGFDVVVAAGGDGTINEVLNGLGAQPAGGPFLGVVPLGTANVFANEIGIGRNLADCARVIATSPAVSLYHGRVNGRRFVQMAGIGFDARVVADVTPRLKRGLGRFAYVFLTLRGLFRYRLPRFAIEIDGVAYEASSVVIAKGHFYGGRFSCTPEARPDDPCLHICLFEQGGSWNVLRYSFGLLCGRLAHYPDVRIVTGRRIHVEGLTGEPVQADGDIVASLPVDAELVPAALGVIVPSGHFLAADRQEAAQSHAPYG